MDRYPESAVASTAVDDQALHQPEQVMSSLRNAIVQCEQQKLLRSVQELKLRLAQTLIEVKSWDDALRILRPLWQSMSYRNEGWWDIVEEVGWALRTVAAHTGDGGTIITVDWELMNSTFKPRPEWRYDLMGGLDGLETVNFKPAVVIRDQDVHSFLSATFAFENAEGKVGESSISQLTVTSQAQAGSAPVAVTEIKIAFEGSMRPVTLLHKPKAGNEEPRSGGIIHSIVALRDTPSVTDGQLRSRDIRSTPLQGGADLTFRPAKSKVFEFVCALREPGEAIAISATFTLTSELFDLDYIVNFNRMVAPDVWWCQKHAKKRLVRADPHAMNILPKPPKMDVRFAVLQDQYYTNEPITLQLNISNGEDEESVADLVVQIAGDQAPAFILRSGESTNDKDDSVTTDAGSSTLELGSIASLGSTSAVIELPPVMLPAIYDLTVQLSYHLVSDMETPISKTTTVRLLVVSPFEANYDFSPRLDLTPWPSFFAYNEDDESLEKKGQPKAVGLSQKWCLTTRYASFAAEPLVIEDVDIDILSLNGGITCSTTKVDVPGRETPLYIQPNTIDESQFFVSTRKISLDDRRSASLDLHLVIKWRRSPTQTSPQARVNTTHLPVPRLLVAGSEPRVLASVTYSFTPPPAIPLLTLSYTIENPSMHFLTFGIVMNPSENFAFSGVKQGTVQLLPLSRRTVSLRVLPSVRGEWIRPLFVVRDRYFQKILKVIATEGMRSDKDGVLVWVPPEEDI